MVVLDDEEDEEEDEQGDVVIIQGVYCPLDDPTIKATLERTNEEAYVQACHKVGSKSCGISQATVTRSALKCKGGVMTLSVTLFSSLPSATTTTTRLTNSLWWKRRGY